MPLSPGDIIYDRYRIDDLLATGGMSTVYQAWDLRLGVPRALKEMIPYPGLDERALAQLRDQFLQEAQVLAELRHPNLPRVTDHFENKGSAYLAMDLVEGQRLDILIEQEGALLHEAILDWVKELLDALNYCHEHDVIHRDVKPHNVIITPQGRAMLVDFGLVKVLNVDDRRTRTVMRGLGTPEYAPPEQYDADIGSTDERTDIYGLGATLYHALTGTPPPTATQRIVDPTLLKPVSHYVSDIRRSVNDAIARSLSLQPVHRFRNVKEMAEALFGPSTVKPASSPSDGGARSTSDPLATAVLSGLGRISRRRRWIIAGAGAAVLLMTFVILQVVLPLGVTSTATPTPSVAIAVATTTFTPSPQPTRSATPTVTAIPATDTPEPIAVPATATASATPTPTLTATPTASQTPEPTDTGAAACISDVELVEVDTPYSYWYPRSPVSFDLLLHNNGTCPWPEETKLVLVSENTFDWPDSWQVGFVDSGETQVVGIRVTAPSTPQTVHIVWQLEGANEQPIGSRITWDLRVEQSTPTATEPPLTPTPTTPPPPSTSTFTPTPTPTITPTPSDTPTPTPTPTETPRGTTAP